MLKNKQRIKGTITSIDTNGTGVFYHHKDKVLVRHVMQDEEVEVIIEKRIKDAYVATVVKVLKPHANRVKVECPYYEKCGGCHLLHVDYTYQMQMKKDMVQTLLQKEKMTGIQLQECQGMVHPFAYRNKIIISFANDKKEVKAGFYGEYSHRIIPIKNCLMHEEKVNTFIEDIKTIVKKCRVSIFDEDRRTGFLRHILIRRAVETDQTMLVIVGAEKIFKAKSAFLKEVKHRYPEIDTVVFNYNPRKTSVVLGTQEQVILGKGYIEDVLCDKRFSISSRSFYQINHSQCEALYRKALSLLSLTGKETLLDAYCGIGTIGLIAANKVAKVIGVEVNQEAIKDAISNAKRNKINNAQFICDDASNYMVQLAKAKKTIDVVIMDPAREGSDERFLSSLVALNPKQVVYISCNPQTQIRDLKYLQRHGWTSKQMYLYDLFPNTFHVESIVLLAKA